MRATPQKPEAKAFGAWANAKSRCTSQNNRAYPKYGGRGIKMCDAWLHDFKQFYADLGPPPPSDTRKNEYQLDRIDNDGDYEPTNCRWATRAQQMANRSVTVRITVDGVTKTLHQWAEDVGLSHHTLLWRRKKNMSPQDVVFNPKYCRQNTKLICIKGNPMNPDMKSISVEEGDYKNLFIILGQWLTGKSIQQPNDSVVAGLLWQKMNATLTARSGGKPQDPGLILHKFPPQSSETETPADK